MYNDLDFELNAAELQRYSRQILLPEWEMNAQEKLKFSNVCIVGCGDIGCLSAELLARAGVGKITLVDPDTVDLSHLQCQIAFTTNNVGFYKAEILAQRLQQINPCIEVVAYSTAFTAENAAQLLAEQDLVLESCEYLATRYLLNQQCYQANVPLLSAAAQGMDGQLLLVDQSACYACIFPEHTQQAQRCQDTGILVTTPNVLASLQAHHALLYLGQDQAILKNKLLLWQGQSLSSRILNVNFRADCPVCQAQ